MSRRPHPIVRQIIDRDCHVSLSNSEVIRHVVSKLRNGHLTFREMARADRRRLMADCIQIHGHNQAMYRDVMGGSIRPRRKRRGKGTGPPETPTSLSGKDVVCLMRRNRWTIARLAIRLGITQKRVRQVREKGLGDALAVRDWIEGITGIDPGPIPNPFVIRQPADAGPCGECGRSLVVGNCVFQYVGELFCSITCCRKNRGWN